MKATEFRIGNVALIDNEKHWGSLMNEVMVITGFKEFYHKSFPECKYSIDLKPLELNKKSIIVDPEFHQADKFIIPIPINEEWLLRTGGKVKDTILAKYFNYEVNNNFVITLSWCNDKGKGEYYVLIRQEDEVISLPKRIFFVHEWQNLYFTLTGEELKLRPTAA